MRFNGSICRILSVILVFAACLFYCGAGCGNVATPSSASAGGQSGGLALLRSWSLLQGTWVKDGELETIQSINFEPARVTLISYGTSYVYPVYADRSLITAGRYEQLTGYAVYAADIVVVCDNGVDAVSYIPIEFIGSDAFLFGSSIYRRKSGGWAGGGGSGNGNYSGAYVYVKKGAKDYSGSITLSDDGTFTFSGDKANVASGGKWEVLSDTRVRMCVEYGGFSFTDSFILFSSGDIFTFTSESEQHSLILSHFFGFMPGELSIEMRRQ